MKKSILITGSSAGLGKAVVEYFAAKDWNVVATMRNTSKGEVFKNNPNILVVKLDVTLKETIQPAINEAIKKFGRVDVLFNNVGYGGLQVFEETSDESYRKAFETNFFGHLNVIRSVLPQMRKQKSGFIINVTSLAGLFGIPIQTAYTASKFAMTGFTESHKWELQKQGIDTTVFEVGGMKTEFVNHMTNDREYVIDDYSTYMDKMIPTIEKATEKFQNNATPAEMVAKEVFKLVQMRKKPFRYHPTKDGKIIGFMKRFLSDKMFRKMSTMGLDA